MFRSCMDASLVDFQIDILCPQDTYSHFCDILRTATAKSVPNLNNSSCSTISHQSCPKNPSKKPYLPWWNQKCSEAVLNFKEAYLKVKYNPTEESYLEFKIPRALKKLTIKIERQNSWVLLCEIFNRCTPLSVIWKFMRKFNKTYTPNNNEDDTWILDFLMKYTPDFVINTPNAVDTSSLNPSNSFLLNPFSINELNSAVFSRRDTAFGLDGIHYILFKKMSSHSLEFFLKVLNLLWDYNDIPPDWKIDCLVPILKPNKPKLSPDSYQKFSSNTIGTFMDLDSLLWVFVKVASCHL
ncbi:putative pol-like protein [Operophtera brumata]|uniref:Putative pol-like protein n=1 Tax=Operophtera brumata TaxID=104452 RepID=A0A0L7LQX6_OPEBR|nr:putative pol-like protein [Operophtera brumata]